MGLLKTEKLDNGEIGFECIYGGLEAPFGGIDASRAARYINPKCFADASNFLLVDNELSIGYLTQAFIPIPSGISYPVGSFVSTPALLIGVGRLPCENVNKNWALYVSPSPDSNNNWTYQLMLWTTDGGSPTVETHTFTLVGQQIIAPAVQATAVLTVAYNYPFTANQSMAAYALTPHGGGTPAIPPTYDSLFYEITKWNPAITGVGAGYASNFPFAPTLAFGNTPASGPVTIPTPATVITAIIASMAGRTDIPFKATAIAGQPNSLLLTAFTQTGAASVDGAAGNSISLTGTTFSFEFGYFPPATAASLVIVPGTDISSSFPYYGPNPFAKPSFQINVTPFTGGTNAGQVIYSNAPIQQLTYETVGDNLFLAGWPAGYMLQYSNTTKQFSYLTQYQGARVLKKMAGHLISVGMINSIQQTETNTHLWFNWSQYGQFNQWNALDNNNLQTGAGGAQLADISDQLTGLVISNSIAFILRAEGLSYAAVLQTAQIPFDFNHVALCKDGQGCPSTVLWAQFDQVGLYVGQSNIFMLAQSPQAIGDQIWPMLFPQLASISNRLSDPPAPFTIVGNPPPFQDLYYTKVNVEPLIFPRNNRVVTQFGINLAGIIFLFDPIDGAWMKLDTGPIFGPETTTGFAHLRWNILKCCSLYGNCTVGYDGSFQNKESYVYGQASQGGLIQAPIMYRFDVGISAVQNAHIWFPQEEISFGRDITIDAVYVLATGVPGAEVDFTIDGWQGNPSTFITAAFSGKLIFGPSANPQSFEEYAVFNADGSAITLKAPQLKLNVPAQAVSYTNIVPYPINCDSYIKFAKVAMFGKFDPAQRPV